MISQVSRVDSAGNVLEPSAISLEQFARLGGDPRERGEVGVLLPLRHGDVTLRPVIEHEAAVPIDMGRADATGDGDGDGAGEELPVVVRSRAAEQEVALFGHARIGRECFRQVEERGPLMIVQELFAPREEGGVRRALLAHAAGVARQERCTAVKVLASDERVLGDLDRAGYLRTGVSPGMQYPEQAGFERPDLRDARTWYLTGGDSDVDYD